MDEPRLPDASRTRVLSLAVRRAEPADKPTLWRLLQLYLHDFSEFLPTDLGPDGEFEYPYFDAYWTELGRAPLVIEAGGHLAGFALVRSGVPNDLAEFFVLRRYRRQGVGRQAVAAVRRCSAISRANGRCANSTRTTAPRPSGAWPSRIRSPRSGTPNGPVQRFVVPTSPPPLTGGSGRSVIDPVNQARESRRGSSRSAGSCIADLA